MHRLKCFVLPMLIVALVSCAGDPPGPPRAAVSPKGTTAAAQPASLHTVNLIVFPGGFNWPIWVAQEKGFFARNSVEVKITPTPSSVFQLTNLIDGKFDIAMTAIDNL